MPYLPIQRAILATHIHWINSDQFLQVPLRSVNTYLEFKPGNHAQFTIIFWLFYKPLCFFSNRLLKDWDNAEDIVVEVFVKLGHNKGDFKGTGAIKAWLYKCTYNHCLKHIDATKRLARYQIELVDNQNCLTQMIAKENMELIHRYVDTLPRQCKSIVKLSFFLGLDNTEIASIFNISQSTVKNQKARGIYLIRKRLAANSI